MIQFNQLRVDNDAMKAEEASGCGCTTTDCCDTIENSSSSCCDSKEHKPEQNLPATITIDGKTVDVQPEDQNIVDVARRAKIAIPAPCYLAGRKKGCCKACVVEIEGQQRYACTTKPGEGMEVITDRQDLKELRKERLLKYNEQVKSGNFTPCSSEA